MAANISTYGEQLSGGTAQRRDHLRRERPDALSVRRGCQLMDLARSTHYYRPKGRCKDDEALIARIEAICAEFPRYGYRRVTAQLRHEGRCVNHKRVARIMRERGLSVKARRQAVRTSDAGCREAVFPNLPRDFVPSGPNELRVGDIPYIHTRLAFVYLAVILDAWSRRVIGYAVSRQIDTRLTIAAVVHSISLNAASSSSSGDVKGMRKWGVLLRQRYLGIQATFDGEILNRR